MARTRSGHASSNQAFGAFFFGFIAGMAVQALWLGHHVADANRERAWHEAAMAVMSKKQIEAIDEEADVRDVPCDDGCDNRAGRFGGY